MVCCCHHSQIAEMASDWMGVCVGLQNMGPDLSGSDVARVSSKDQQEHN